VSSFRECNISSRNVIAGYHSRYFQRTHIGTKRMYARRISHSHYLAGVRAYKAARTGQSLRSDGDFGQRCSPQKRPNVIRYARIFKAASCLTDPANFRLPCSIPKITISTRILRRISNSHGENLPPFPRLQYPTGDRRDGWGGCGEEE